MTMTIKDFTITGLTTLDFRSETVPDFAADYQYWRTLADTQPGDTRRELQQQARILAQDILTGQYRTGFLLPARVVTELPDARGVSRPPTEIPDALRGYWVGTLINQLFKVDLRFQVRSRFAELESDPDSRVVIAAGLLRLHLAESLVAHVAALNEADNQASDQPEASLKHMRGSIDILHTARALAASSLPRRVIVSSTTASSRASSSRGIPSRAVRSASSSASCATASSGMACIAAST